MDIKRLYDDYGIAYVTEGMHKHARHGWINTECPHCVGSGNPGYHLGYNMFSDYFRCWRCGWHTPVKTLSLLLNQSEYDVHNLIKSYGIIRSAIDFVPKEKKEFLLPSNISKLKKQHKTYLKERGFSPSKLEKLFKLKGTTSYSILDDGHGKSLDYRFRIIIPFIIDNEIVSFDARDITNLQFSKYQACPATRETMPHKNIIYGVQEAWGDVGICVEGPSDVWRLGENAFATSGIEYKQAQVRMISSIFKKIAVIYDDEPQAQKQARKLVKDLQFRNVEAYNIKIKGDPGDLPQRAANKLVKKILNK